MGRRIRARTFGVVVSLESVHYVSDLDILWSNKNGYLSWNRQRTNKSIDFENTLLRDLARAEIGYLALKSIISFGRKVDKTIAHSVRELC